MKLLLSSVVMLCFACKQPGKKNIATETPEQTKQQLLALESKWLEYEFNLDTASIAGFLDDDFISISATDTSNKQMELEGIYKNISAMRDDSIFIDSFKIEEPFIVKQFDNSAVTIFICHTYKKDKGRPVEKKTKFYDVWINRNGNWKALSSQATVIIQ
jgi:hypothetical protein